MRKLVCLLVGHKHHCQREDKAMLYLPGENTVEGAMDFCDRCGAVVIRGLTNKEFESFVRAAVVQEEVKKIQKQYDDNTVEFLQKHKNKIN